MSSSIMFTVTVFSLVNDEGKVERPEVAVFRNHNDLVNLNTAIEEYSLASNVKAFNGALCDSPQACKHWLLNAATNYIPQFLNDIPAASSDNTIKLCETIVNLHRYTNDKNQSLRSEFLRLLSTGDLFGMCKLAYSLIDSLPLDLFE